MDAVGREFAELNAEHIRSMREQQRLTELLQRCETERVQALRSLHDTKAQLRECKCFFFFFLWVITVNCHIRTVQVMLPFRWIGEHAYTTNELS
jgi:hypothetical protein